MAPQGKFTVLVDDVQPKDTSKKKFRIPQSNDAKEIKVDVDIAIVDDGDYLVERLSLPDTAIKFNGQDIRWFTNFAIKTRSDKQPIKNKSYTVTIKGLADKLAEKNSQLVVYYGSGDPVAVTSSGDSFTLTNGDPAPGMVP